MTQSRLFVSDLDRTLISSAGVLSEFGRKHLTAMLDAGLNFTVATARTVSEIHPVLGDLPLRLPVIAVNGAFLSDFKTGKHFVINHLSQELAEAVFAVIMKRNFQPFVCAVDDGRDFIYYQIITNPSMEWFRNTLATSSAHRLRCVNNINDTLRYKVISYVMMGDKEPVAELAAAMDEHFPGLLENFHFENPYSSGSWWLTIHDKKVCKSTGLKELMGLTGFTKDQLTVFGDHINDIGMFELAGHAVAVANAEESVKRAADEIIGTNDEDSVVKYIAKQLGYEQK